MKPVLAVAAIDAAPVVVVVQQGPTERNDTAKTLVRTMRRLRHRPDLQGRLEAGDVGFDRVEALSRIPEDVGLATSRRADTHSDSDRDPSAVAT